MSKLYTCQDDWVLTHHALDAELVAEPEMNEIPTTSLHSLFSSYNNFDANGVDCQDSIDSLFVSRRSGQNLEHHQHAEREQDSGSSSESGSSNVSRKTKQTSSSMSPLSLPSYSPSSHTKLHHHRKSSSKSHGEHEKSSKSRRRHKKSRQPI